MLGGGTQVGVKLHATMVRWFSGDDKEEIFFCALKIKCACESHIGCFLRFFQRQNLCFTWTTSHFFHGHLFRFLLVVENSHICNRSMVFEFLCGHNFRFPQRIYNFFHTCFFNHGYNFSTFSLVFVFFREKTMVKGKTINSM